MTDSSSIGKFITTSSTFIEKATELRHFMLLISLILALDSCLLIFYKKGLLQSFGNLNAPEVNAAGALLFLGIFAFLMAIFFPAFRQIALLAASWIKVRYSKNIDSVNYDYRYPSLARRKAIIERDKLIIELLDKHEEKRASHEVNMNIGFGLVFLFAINYFLLGSQQSLSITQAISTLLEMDTGPLIKILIKLTYATFAAFMLIILFMSISPETDEKIYLPETDEEKAVRTKKLETYQSSHSETHIDN